MGVSEADDLRGVFERGDLEAFFALMDPEVVWTWWEPGPACRNRDEARRRIEELLAQGQWGRPEIVADLGKRVVVDPHPEPTFALAPEIHHVYTFRGGRIVRMEDYPDRRSALAAAERPNEPVAGGAA
jgi:ketosteroid isomerase-like protein